jgi:hypothetical protein
MLPATRDRNSVPAGDPAETIGMNRKTIQPRSQIALIFLWDHPHDRLVRPPPLMT